MNQHKNINVNQGRNLCPSVPPTGEKGNLNSLISGGVEKGFDSSREQQLVSLSNLEGWKDFLSLHSSSVLSPAVLQVAWWQNAWNWYVPLFRRNNRYVSECSAEKGHTAAQKDIMTTYSSCSNSISFLHSVVRLLSGSMIWLLSLSFLCFSCSAATLTAIAAILAAFLNASAGRSTGGVVDVGTEGVLVLVLTVAVAPAMAIADCCIASSFALLFLSIGGPGDFSLS